MATLKFPDKLKAQDPSVNRYLDTRREWNERYGSYIAREKNWKIFAFISLGIAFLSVAGVVYMGSQNKIVPYVVEVDKLGSAVAIHRADVASTPDQRVIRSQLAKWISDIRSVYLDAAAEHNILKEGYAMVNQHGAAFTALNDYFRANNPFEKAKEEAVSVQVESVLPISDNTWRVEWKEEHRSRNGVLLSTRDEQASITITIKPPTDEPTILQNPTGVYVNNFSWSERL